MRYRLRNWSKYQNLQNDRKSNPWVKLHRSLLSDYEVMNLPEAHRFQLIGLFLVADSKTGELPEKEEEIKWRLNVKEFDFALFNSWIEPIIQDGSKMDPERIQDGFSDGSNLDRTQDPKWSPREEERREEIEERRDREETSYAAQNVQREEEVLPRNSFPVKDAEYWQLTPEYFEKLKKTFPRLDIPEQLRIAKLWLESSPRNLKTSQGMPKFLTNWMARKLKDLPPEPKRTDRVQDLPKRTDVEAV